MSNSFLSELLTTGSFIIATASGLGVGAAGGALLKSKGFRPFIVLFGVVSLVAAAAQYYFWNAVAHGTTTLDNAVIPSGIGSAELFEVFLRQSVVLVFALHVARKDALKQTSASRMLLHGALSAPVGFVIGIILQVLLTVVLAVGCFTSMETCHF